jgi:hypothetical protein
MPVLIAALATVCSLASGQEGAPRQPEADASNDRGPVVAAVLDYEVDLPDSEGLGAQIADILTARLSIEESPQLVERAKLGEILKEQKLNLAGLIDQEQVLQVGKLTGAQLLIMGKAFKMDKQLMIVTKVVGVETSRVKGTLLKVDLSGELSDSLMTLGQQIAQLIRTEAGNLLPPKVSLPDPVAAAKKALAAKRLPTVAVVIPEEHLSRAVADPAVETEIKKVLIDAGVTVVDVGRNDLAEWARGMMKEQTAPWPDALTDADTVIVGEAFSELAGHVEDLVSAAARAEVNMIDRQTGHIVLADRDTQRAVDLAEVNAGKTALQKAGRRLGVRILQHLVKTLPDAPAAGKGEPPKETEAAD